MLSIDLIGFDLLEISINYDDFISFHIGELGRPCEQWREASVHAGRMLQCARIPCMLIRQPAAVNLAAQHHRHCERQFAMNTQSTKARRANLLHTAEAAARGSHGDLAALLGRFMLVQVPELSDFVR